MTEKTKTDEALLKLLPKCDFPDCIDGVITEAIGSYDRYDNDGNYWGTDTEWSYYECPACVEREQQFLTEEKDMAPTVTVNHETQRVEMVVGDNTEELTVEDAKALASLLMTARQSLEDYRRDLQTSGGVLK